MSWSYPRLSAFIRGHSFSSHVGSSVADLDLRPFVLRRFFEPRDRVPRQLEEWLAHALPPHDRLTRIAPDPHLRIQRQLAPEGDLHFVRRGPPPAVAEHVDALRAVRARQI